MALDGTDRVGARHPPLPGYDGAQRAASTGSSWTIIIDGVVVNDPWGRPWGGTDPYGRPFGPGTAPFDPPGPYPGDPCDDPDVPLKRKLTLGCMPLHERHECTTDPVLVPAPEPFPSWLPPWEEWAGNNPCLPDASSDYYELLLPAMCGEFAECELECALPTHDELEDAKSFFDFEMDPDYAPGQETEYEDLIAYAWAFLIANMDIISWLLCYFQDIVDELDAPDQEVEVVDYLDLTECFIQRLMTHEFHEPYSIRVSSTRTSIITVFQSDRYAMTFVMTFGTLFQSAYFSRWERAQSVEDQLCIIATLAGSMLTELLHNCGQDNPHDYTCDITLSVKNAFLYLIWRRYPCLNQSCCATPAAHTFGSQLRLHPLDGSC